MSGMENVDPKIQKKSGFHLATLLSVGLLVLVVAAVALQSVWTSNASSLLQQVKSADVFRLASEPGVELTVVNVWATWCGPCQEEMPELIKFKKEYEPKGVRLVLVSANELAEQSEAEKFLTEVGADFPSFILGESPGSFVAGMKPDWTGGLPATFVLDSQGGIKKFWVGPSTSSELAAKVDPFLTP